MPTAPVEPLTRLVRPLAAVFAELLAPMIVVLLTTGLLTPVTAVIRAPLIAVCTAVLPGPTMTVLLRVRSRTGAVELRKVPFPKDGV